MEQKPNVDKNTIKDPIEEIWNANPRIPFMQSKEILRFGFNGSPQSLEQIARMYNLTRERIRQIEVRSINKLRKRYMRNNNFVDFFDNNPVLKFK